MSLNWPKPYCKVLTRDQIRLILRIYLIDKQVRRQQGFGRCTNGLKARLAAEFGVKLKLVEEITESTGRNRRKFRDIHVQSERTHARFRRLGRARYRKALAGDRTEQDPTGSG